MTDIGSLNADQLERSLEQFIELLKDAVESGASVGFMLPMAHQKAHAYWQSVIAAINERTRILLAVSDGEGFCGSLQIALETRENGDHRGELMKLFVHRRARRRGLAKALLAEAEKSARSAGRSLLMMDTRKGGDAEMLCQRLGYVRLGEVPQYARSANGELQTTVFLYRLLA